MIRGLVGALVAGVSLAGCSVGSEDAGGRSTDDRGGADAPRTSAPSDQPTSTRSPPSPSPTPSSAIETESEPRQLASDGRARYSSLGIPAIGVTGLRVVPYRGSPDDAPGTQIQNGGVAATPFGPDGGVGPGGVGNFIVTAHRTSSTRAFARLPELRPGDRVHVEVGSRKRQVRYTYEIVRTRSTSFRSAASLERQSAAVPGRPGRTPTRPMVTLSTCATPEDHAQGNFWADEFGNPEHRIDKIGVLVARRTL
jgi:sortase A